MLIQGVLEPTWCFLSADEKSKKQFVVLGLDIGLQRFPCQSKL